MKSVKCNKRSFRRNLVFKIRFMKAFGCKVSLIAKCKVYLIIPILLFKIQPFKELQLR